MGMSDAPADPHRSTSDVRKRWRLGRAKILSTESHIEIEHKPFTVYRVRVEPGDVVRAEWEADLQDGKVTTPLRYSMACGINDDEGALELMNAAAAA